MVGESASLEAMRIDFAKGTDVGRQRGHNEDYVDAFSPPDSAQRRQKGQLFIVADGVGGHQAGEVASRSAVQTVSREYYADPDPSVTAALVRSIQTANALIHQQAKEALSQIGMGTTIVAAVARGSELLLANVGDSRAYLLRNGTLRQVTRDHSFVEEQIRAGILTREEARGHPQRNVITRALGAKPDVEVDTYSGTLMPGDTLLLCTDGLSESVRDQEIASVLKQHPPQEAVPRLIALANERGGSDNITALVVFAAPVDEATATTRPVSVIPTAETTEGKDRSSLAIFGLGVAGLLILAAAAAGVFFLAPELIGGAEAATPTPTVQPATAVPSPLPTSTEVAGGEPTATPLLGFSLLTPPDGAQFTAGAEVNFRWRTIGGLPEPYEFVLRTNAAGYEELCRWDQESCMLPLDPGEYEWWVEVWRGDRLLAESEHRDLTIELEPSETPEPVVTETSAPSPADTPESSGGS